MTLDDDMIQAARKAKGRVLTFDGRLRAHDEDGDLTCVIGPAAVSR